MKKLSVILMMAALLALPAVLRAQPPGSTARPGFNRFDLDFKGGTPGELLAAIETASGRPVNAIVPDEYAQTHLPALKMKEVTVPKLFEALRGATTRYTNYVTGYYPGFGGGNGGRNNAQYQSYTISYGFRTTGEPSADSVWFFYYDLPAASPNSAPPPNEGKVCRFFQLGPYLETYKIEDITTAIETGWRMLGTSNRPDISFHKDTKLLIAVGEPGDLALIDSVLQQLPNNKPSTVENDFQKRLDRILKAQAPNNMPAPEPPKPPAKIGASDQQ